MKTERWPMDTSLEQWKASGQIFAYRGYPIFYRDEGSGPALLCIHGFPTASWDWHRVWPMLVDRYRLIAADMIGFGFSSKPRDYSYSIGDQVTLHESLLAFLGVSEVHILAHDYGDTVAQELLARFEVRQRANGAGLQIRIDLLSERRVVPGNASRKADSEASPYPPGSSTGSPLQ